MVNIIDIRSRTKRTNGTRKLSQVKNIARHHSATATGNFDTFWKHWHNVRGWGTGGYHEIILRDGSVELCYGPEEITNGVANLNTSVYNICLVGNGSFTDAQERTFDIRAKNAMKLFGLPTTAVKGHGEMPGAQTSCPGINMTAVRKRLSGGGTVDQASKPKPPTTNKPVSKPSTNQTTSIVDYLNSKGINSSADNRKKLAIKYGVKNYDLTGAKNTELLNKMRAGKPVSKPKPTPKPKGKTLYLPKSASSWRVYPTNKAPVKANALPTKLNPKKFGGLSYKVLANPQKDVYTIQTAQLGKVNIYAGPGTGAVIK